MAISPPRYLVRASDPARPWVNLAGSNEFLLPRRSHGVRHVHTGPLMRITNVWGGPPVCCRSGDRVWFHSVLNILWAPSRPTPVDFFVWGEGPLPSKRYPWRVSWPGSWTPTPAVTCDWCHPCAVVDFDYGMRLCVSNDLLTLFHVGVVCWPCVSYFHVMWLAVLLGCPWYHFG